MLSITGESREKVDPWVEEHGALYPILCQAQSGDYSTGGVPTAYLIAADGTVAWHGHPGDLQDGHIEKHLKDVEKENRVSTWAFTLARQLPDVPEAMAAVVKLLEKKKFGAALKKAETTVAKLESDEQTAGETVREWIASRAQADLEAAAEHTRERKFYKAYVLYGRVEERFKGHDLAKQAKGAAKALKKDKESGLEIKASEKLEKIKKDMREEKKPEDKLKCLKPLLAKKYADTLAGQEAAKLAEDLEGKIEK